jgi:hypothetical protein
LVSDVGFTPESTPAIERLVSLWDALDDATRDEWRAYVAKLGDSFD